MHACIQVVGRLLVIGAFGAGCTLTGLAQAIPLEQANEARIDQLLSQMTLEEKMNLIRGDVEDPAVYQGQAGFLPGVPRLGIPGLRFADGPPGVLTRVPAQAETATMGVAATWSVADAEANGAVIGREARSLGIDVVLQPFINIDRDITFARGYNTFGEDPMLTGAMGAAEIRGAQAQGVMAQAKHYVGYDTDSYNVFIDQQTLHEVYAAPFADAIAAGVSSVMCSYNKLNGPFACGNGDSLKTILKGELKFKGFVTSDWGAVHSVSFINEGLDMEMPGTSPPDSPFAAMMHTFFETGSKSSAMPTKMNEAVLAGMLGGTIPEEPKTGGMDFSAFPRDRDTKVMRDALADGSVTEATVTAAARRILYEIDRFGYLDGKQKHDVTAQDVEVNAAVIRKTAADAAVLLKNEGVLPLKSGETIAMIGPSAGQVAAIGTFGERSGGLTERQVGPVDALKKLAPGAQITFAVDDDMTGVPVDAGRLSHGGKPGLLRTTAGKTSVDAELNATMSNGQAVAANTDVTWTGTLTVPKAGSYWLYLQVLGARAVLSIDGKDVARTGATKGTVHGDIQHATQDNGFPTTDGLDNVRRALELTAGAHALAVRVSGDTSNNPEQVCLNWMTPDRRLADHAAAIEAARHAKVAVVFVWTRGKPDFGLPGQQDRLVEEVAAVNPNTVVVLNVSQPIAMPWLSKVKGVLQMWWPGDEGGWSTADVLLGNVNPGGHLPFTWARKLTDYAANDPAHPERSAKGVDGKTTFSEGVDIGYRWFDAQAIDPLYAFGYGLSYTRFQLGGLKVLKATDGGVDVTVEVTNAGDVAGDEVTQVYLDAPANKPQGLQFAPKTLAGFGRVSLAPKQTKSQTIHIASRAFEAWSTSESKWARFAARKLEVGESSRDLKLSAVTE